MSGLMFMKNIRETASSQSINKWDEQYEIGYIDEQGVPQYATNAIRSANYCVCTGGAKYFVRCGYKETASSIRYLTIFFYDANKKFIGSSWCSGVVVQVPDTACFFKISTSTSDYVYGAYYYNNISVNSPITYTDYIASTLGKHEANINLVGNAIGNGSWNQIINPSETNDESAPASSGVEIVNNRDGSYTINTGTSGASTSVSYIVYENFQTHLTAGHDYLFCGCPNNGGVAKYCFIVDSEHYDVGDGVLYTHTSGNTVNLRISITKGTVMSDIMFWPQCFDLSGIFGSGGEPQSIEEFRKIFDQKYYPYLSQTGGGTVTISGANRGLSIDSGKNVGHSNSITSSNALFIRGFSYDGYGHISGTTVVKGVNGVTITTYGIISGVTANASVAGVVSTGDQVFSGSKTFNDPVEFLDNASFGGVNTLGQIELANETKSGELYSMTKIQGSIASSSVTLTLPTLSGTLARLEDVTATVAEHMNNNSCTSSRTSTSNSEATFYLTVDNNLGTKKLEIVKKFSFDDLISDGVLYCQDLGKIEIPLGYRPESITSISVGAIFDEGNAYSWIGSLSKDNSCINNVYIGRGSNIPVSGTIYITVNS